MLLINDSLHKVVLYDAYFWSMNSCLVCACTVYQQKGETPLMKAVNKEWFSVNGERFVLNNEWFSVNNKWSVVKYLINHCKVDITELDQVRYEYNRCS